MSMKYNKSDNKIQLGSGSWVDQSGDSADKTQPVTVKNEDKASVLKDRQADIWVAARQYPKDVESAAEYISLVADKKIDFCALLHIAAKEAMISMQLDENGERLPGFLKREHFLAAADAAWSLSLATFMGVVAAIVNEEDPPENTKNKSGRRRKNK